MDEFAMRPIGWVRTCYPEKFGVPRQAGMAGSARGRLVFAPDYGCKEAVEGLEGFSHVWVVFVFHEVRAEEVRLRVRPPRLGGNERLGVFATRSPFRPNRIGLSACRLDRVGVSGTGGAVLDLSGVDLVDGTPVLDVKPYLSWADAVGEAAGGFAANGPESLEVEVAPEARRDFEALPEDLRELVRDTLRWDARPAYHEEGRRYFTRIMDAEAAWEVRGRTCLVVGVATKGKAEGKARPDEPGSDSGCNKGG